MGRKKKKLILKDVPAPEGYSLTNAFYGDREFRFVYGPFQGEYHVRQGDGTLLEKSPNKETALNSAYTNLCLQATRVHNFEEEYTLIDKTKRGKEIRQRQKQTRRKIRRSQLEDGITSGGGG